MTGIRKVGALILAVLTGLALVLALAFFGVERVAMDLDVYEASYEKHQQAAYIGMDPEDLLRVTDDLLQYLQGKRDSLDGTVVIGGEEREIYGEREKLHMIDVQGLFLAGYTIRRWCIGIAAAGIVILAIWLRKDAVRYIMTGYIAALVLLLIAGGALGIAVAKDFTSAFIRFHEIFFDNDLWLLYADDMLIMMFPEEFFNEITIRILLKVLETVLIPFLAWAAYAIGTRILRRVRHAE